MGRSKACIFVVDDQKAIVESIEAQFAYAGYEVIKATDAKRALNLSESLTPDLIITDIRMPRLDGLTLIKGMKERHPRLKVIVITGYAPEYEKNLDQALKAGLVDRVVPKPFSAAELDRLVRELLKSPADDAKKGPSLGRILIVDDEVEVTDFLKDYFRHLNYAATVASSVDEALALHENFNPDLILSDIKMPGRDGFELVSEVRKRDSEVQFIMMTGQPDQGFLQKMKQAGIEKYFVKPLSVTDVEQLVRSITKMMKKPKDKRPLSKDRRV